MKRLYTYILFVFLFTSKMFAQSVNDSVLLPVINLEENRLSTNSIGSDINIINKEIIGNSSIQNLSDFMSTNTSLYIKKYGALSTPTFRGTSSSHTLVLWNGLNINSVANGLADFSIIPINSFSETKIVHGGDGSVFGSGAVGGSIHFNTDLNFTPKKKIKLTIERGSYGLESKSVTFHHTKENLSISMLLHNMIDKNKFNFINTSKIGNPKEINNYGTTKSNQFQLNLAYMINNNNKLKFFYWQCYNDREVPQNMTIPNSDAKQYDDFNRFLITSNHMFSNINLNIKQAYIKEVFKYTEISKNINSFFTAESYISDIDLKMYKNNYLFNIGGVATNNLISNNNYISNSLQEKNFAVFSALQFKSKIFSVNTIIRKEWQPTYFMPIVPTIAFEYSINQYLNIRAKYNMNFRSPTFNDRFWIGSGSEGNLSLVPEKSWNNEIGFDSKIQSIDFSSTLYSLVISDMIVWQSLDNGIWTPNNIKSVWSRGVESRFEYSSKNIDLEFNYSHTISTNENKSDNLDSSEGKQLRYVPISKGNLTFIFTKNNNQFLINQSYTGDVITTYGNPIDKKLKAFFLTDISIRTKYRKIPLSSDLRINNLFNKSYQTYQNYPNPGREFLLTLNYQIN